MGCWLAGGGEAGLDVGKLVQQALPATFELVRPVVEVVRAEVVVGPLVGEHVPDRDDELVHEERAKGCSIIGAALAEKSPLTAAAWYCI